MSHFTKRKLHTQRLYVYVCSVVALAGLCLSTTAAQASEPSRFGATSVDVTIVEYFDYDCPYCEKLEPALRGLPVHDPGFGLFTEYPPLTRCPSRLGQYCSITRGESGWRLVEDFSRKSQAWALRQ